jgi:hypothetical protein
MKKHLLFLLILFSCCAKSQTSVYHAFPDSAVIWREDANGISFSCCCAGNCWSYEEYQYVLGTDTLINGVMRKKLFQHGSNTTGIIGPPNCPPWCQGSSSTTYYNYDYTGSIHQDIPQQKVYYTMPGDTTMQLLYDFTLNVGDTLPPSYNNYEPTNHVVTIDSVLVGSNYHKRFGIAAGNDPTPYVYIIEGIGSTYGLIYPLIPPFESGCNLVCVTVNSIQVYSDSVSACNLITLGRDLPEKQLSISVQPNPFHSSVTLTLDPEFTGGELRIFNVTGHLVLMQYILSTTHTIDRGKLIAGIYFLEVINKSGERIKKKIIVE